MPDSKFTDVIANRIKASGGAVNLSTVGTTDRPEIGTAITSEVVQKALQQHIQKTATHFETGITDTLKNPLFKRFLTPTGLPAHLMGTVLDPQGKPVSRVTVSIQNPLADGSPGARMMTDGAGFFTLVVPNAMQIGFADASFNLAFTGADRNEIKTFNVASVDPNGSLGTITLSGPLMPIPLNVIDQLGQIVANLSVPADGPPVAPPDSVPSVTIGEDICSQMFRADMTVDRFPYCMLVRLVEPLPNVHNLSFTFQGRLYPISLGQYFPDQLNYTFTSRVAIDRPISVSRVRHELAGIGLNDIADANQSIPIAGTLGLGYIVKMAQQWTPTGLALGNLVYSLPLAPGEQQRVAITERTDTSAVQEAETLSEGENQSFFEDDNSSTQAVFHTGMFEAASGGSHFHSESNSSSWAAAGGIGFAMGPIAIGGGAVTSSGHADTDTAASTWMSGVKTYTADAAQSSHAAVERAASAKRELSRTGMRLASASERTEVITKTITNHNRTRALTMQYWEVLRMFDVRSVVDGVNLVCFVPLDVIQFLPTGQPLMLASAALSRVDVLTRYSVLAKNISVLSQVGPTEFIKGLAILQDFVANPQMTVQPPNETSANVIDVTVQGSFLDYEDVSISLIGKNGQTVATARLGKDAPNVAPHALDVDDSGKAFETEEAFYSYLRDKRQNESNTYHAQLLLPMYVDRTTISAIQISRNFRTISLTYPNPLTQTIGSLATAFSNDFVKAISPVHTTYTPDMLERAIGGAYLDIIKVVLLTAGVDPANVPTDKVYLNQNFGRSVRVDSNPSPFPFVQIPLELRYSALLEIEKALQIAVANTVTYSKAIWMSLTPEERVIMLEGFTVGAPMADDSDTVPLLSCVANQVIGFYGNSMVMPFMIPASMFTATADETPLTTGDIQDALTRFHTTGFAAPISKIALPTKGVLGEAVLGHCPSAEKIDLTRFWN